MNTNHDALREALTSDLDEIIRLTVSISRSSEPTTVDHFELLNKRNQMVRDFKARLKPPPTDWMAELGFELQGKDDLWLLVDDCGGEREATTNERVLWDALQKASALSQPMPEAAAQGWRDWVEQRLLNWRQQKVNRSGDQLALDDFMDKQSLDDLIDYVCSEYEGPDPMPSASTAAPEGVKCPIGLEKSHTLCSAGYCDVCKDAKPEQPQPQAQPTLIPDDIHSCGEFCDLPECVAAREAQAQGEPEVLTSDDITLIAGQVTLARKEDGTDPSFVYAFARALEQRVLQSHREAIAEVTRRFEELKRHGVARHVHDEAIAQHRAALEKCVGALENIKDDYAAHDGKRWDIDAAIKQAEEARK